MKILSLVRKNKPMIIILSVTFLLILGGILTRNPGVIANSLILCAFMISVPLVLSHYQKRREIVEVEEKFPMFLRDIVESLRSGSPFHKAIISCEKVDYGKLSRYVKKMANQLSWGIPVSDVLDQFMKKMKNSKKINMAVSILKESYMTGGDVISTLNSVAENLTQLNEAEREKRGILGQYVFLIYFIVFVFVGVLVALNKLMVPVFESATLPSGEVIGLVSPCRFPDNFICKILELPAVGLFGLKDVTSIGSYYLSVFFFMSTIVAIVCGLVAGQIMDNSLISGLRHSLILVMSVWGLLLLLKTVGILGV